MYSFSTRIYFECCKWKHFDPTDTNMYFNSLFLQNIIEIKRSVQKTFSEDTMFFKCEKCCGDFSWFIINIAKNTQHFMNNEFNYGRKICQIVMLNRITNTRVACQYSSQQWIILQYVNTGKYCFILQILILGLFTEVLLISILMLSILNAVLIYWYFQYFTVSVFFVLNH